jgi:hypothetical protein
MSSGNLDAPLPPIASPPTVPPRRFRLPADYYSAPLAEVRPILPAWAPYGCGAAAILFLVLLFAGGSLMTGARLAALLDFVIATSLGELRGMYTPDVTAAHKESFDTAIKRMREDLRNGRVSAQDIRPFLQTMQKAVGDKKVTPQEVEQMTKSAASVKPSAASR